MSTGNQGKKYFHLVGDERPLTFISVIVVDRSYLEEGRTTTTGKLQKILKGSLIEGEFERLVGIIGMVAGTRDFRAQYYRDVLDFSTFMDVGDTCESTAMSSAIMAFLIFIPVSSTPPIKTAGHSTRGQPSPFTYRPSDSGLPHARKVCLSSKDIGTLYFYYICLGFLI